mgnify:CR=1 FL=1
MPVKEEIFGEERSYDHTTSIMHESCGIEFSHGSINDGKPSSPLFPSLEMLLVVLPFDRIEFFLERIVGRQKDSLMEMGDIDIKISPVKLINNIVLITQIVGYNLEDLSDGNWCKMHIGR